MKQSQARIQELQKKLQAIATSQPGSTGSGGASQEVKLQPAVVGVAGDVPESAIAPAACSPGHPSTSLLDEADDGLNPFDALLTDADLVPQAEAFDQHTTHQIQDWQPPQLAPGKTASLPRPTLLPEPLPPMYSQSPTQGQVERQVTDWIQKLEAQINRINQLSVAQETALLELKALSDRADQELTRIQPNPELCAQTNRLIPALHLGVATIPHLRRDAQGQWVLMARPVELMHLGSAKRRRSRLGMERSPGTTSHPRPLPRRRSSSPSWIWPIINQIRELGLLLGLEPTTHPSHRGKAMSPPEPETLSWPECVVWLVGAIAGRAVLNLLLNAVPILGFPAMLLVLISAGGVLYAAIQAPQSGVVWGYRLFLVMAGLLIGGRLV